MDTRTALQTCLAIMKQRAQRFIDDDEWEDAEEHVQVCQRIEAILSQKGLSVHEPTADTLPEFIDVMIDG